MALPQVIVPLRFGTRPLNGPDPVNQQLAQLADQVASHFDAYALMERETARFSTWRKMVPLGEPETGVDTHGVLEIAKKWCAAHGVRDIGLVCGYLHSFRCRLTAEKLGFNVVRVDTVYDCWDPASEHPQSRSKLLFLAYEPLACTYYWLKGWM